MNDKPVKKSMSTAALKEMNGTSDEELGAFDKHGLSQSIQNKLRAQGITYLFPVQYETYDHTLAGNDVIVQANSKDPLSHWGSMANVYTKKSHAPRTRTLIDFQTLDLSNKPELRILSPTRRANPHPQDLHHQQIPFKQNQLIWHPNFARKAMNYQPMMHHIHFVNFSSKLPQQHTCHAKTGKIPEIKFTENTTKRQHFIDPSRFGELCSKHVSTRYENTPYSAAGGIVPAISATKYLPVIYK